MRNSLRRGLFHPDDIKTIGLQPPSPGPMTAPLPSLGHRRSRPSLSPIAPSAPGALGGPSTGRSHSRSSSFVGPSTGSFGRSESRRFPSQPEFGKYAEEDDEDYDDVFGKANGTGESKPDGRVVYRIDVCLLYSASHAMQTLQLNTRLSNKSWVSTDTPVRTV